MYRENKLSPILGVLIGILLLFATRDIIGWKSVGEIFLSVLLILVGLSIIFKRNFRASKTENKEEKIII